MKYISLSGVIENHQFNCELIELICLWKLREQVEHNRKKSNLMINKNKSYPKECKLRFQEGEGVLDNVTY